MAQKLVSSFTATGQSSSFLPDGVDDLISRPFNLSIWGTFVGTVQLERSFDNGVTWLPLTALGSSLAFTAPCSETFTECEASVIYRLNCTAYTSGTINYRLSQ